jgi:hypothetical protein
MPRRCIAVLSLLLLLGPALTQEREEYPAAPEGTWKVVLPMLREAAGNPLWLVRFDKKGDGWDGVILATADRWPKATLSGASAKGGMLKFTIVTDKLSFACEVKLHDVKADKLRGVTSLGRSPTPVELQRTSVTSLDPYDLVKDELARMPLGAEAVGRAIRLLSQAEAKKAKPAEVRAWAEKAVKSAELYGESWQRDILVTVAEVLGDEKGYEKIALNYAQRAERMLGPKEPPGAQKKVLEVLAALLNKAGKDDEAKDVLVRLKKLDFSVKVQPFKGRKGKSSRAVLVELFTGAQCPPCVAADLGFDAVAKTYKPSEVVLLQYHTHIPRPDPLTGPDCEARLAYYDDAIKGTPTILFNGKPGAGGGGDADDAQEKYEEYQAAINPLLEKDAEAEIKLSATRKGDKVKIEAAVSGLARTGDDVRLRVVLTEDVVEYKGSNGLSRHHHVVRHMPGGDAGKALKDKEGKHTFEVDLAEVKKGLEKYLTEYNEKRPFPDKERPLAMKSLKVVAFIQDDKTLDVLQAVQADITAAKE